MIDQLKLLELLRKLGLDELISRTTMNPIATIDLLFSVSSMSAARAMNLIWQRFVAPGECWVYASDSSSQTTVRMTCVVADSTDVFLLAKTRSRLQAIGARDFALGAIKDGSDQFLAGRVVRNWLM